MSKLIYDKARKIWQVPVTEEHIVREIQARLGYSGIKVWRVVERIPWGRKKSTPGIPDLCGWAMVKHLTDGGFEARPKPVPVWIEVKRPGGRHRPAQETFITNAAAAGCVAGFVESWEQVREIFRPHGIELPK